LKFLNHDGVGDLTKKLWILKSDDNWHIFLEKFRNLDIYYSQEYTKLCANAEGGIAETVYYEDKDGKILYPYIKRKIDLKEGFFDIVTPYGYGGPVLEGKNHVIQQFYSQFKVYCENNNIVTETVRLHPLIKNDECIRDIMHVDYIRKTTAVDLSLSLEEIRRGYTSNNHRNIRKAKKEGVKVYLSNNKGDIETFIDIYFETMQRNNAANYYYFSNSYFYRLMEETALSKPYLLLAEYNDQIIGGVVVIFGKEFAHYHLGASKTEFLSLRPNNLLFDYMVEFAKSKGLTTLHLGGGYKEDDGLFKFKSSFTNNNHFHYYLGKNILNRQIYDELSELTEGNSPLGSESSYFPVYRRKV
jgi:hypothetical protein